MFYKRIVAWHFVVLAAAALVLIGFIIFNVSTHSCESDYQGYCGLGLALYTLFTFYFYGGIFFVCWIVSLLVFSSSYFIQRRSFVRSIAPSSSVRVVDNAKDFFTIATTTLLIVIYGIIPFLSNLHLFIISLVYKGQLHHEVTPWWILEQRISFLPFALPFIILAIASFFPIFSARAKNWIVTFLSVFLVLLLGWLASAIFIHNSNLPFTYQARDITVSMWRQSSDIAVGILCLLLLVFLFVGIKSFSKILRKD